MTFDLLSYVKLIFEGAYTPFAVVVVVPVIPVICEEIYIFFLLGYYATVTF